MALQGTLETFSVPEVLRLLAGTRKSGMLAIDGDRGAGQVWLHEGRIAGARSAHEPEGGVEAVLFDLLRYEEGSFVFESDAAYDGDAPADADVEAALGAAEELLEEWHEIASVVPSLQVWVSMVPALSAAEVTVTADQWAALAIVGRGTSGHRLADELGLGELDGSRRIRDLVDAGFVEVDDTPVEPAPLTEEPAAPRDEGPGFDEPLDDPIDDLGEDGTWTTTDDLTVGLAGFVARAADEERSERAPSFAAELEPAPEIAAEPEPEPADVEAVTADLDDVEEDLEVSILDGDHADEPLDDGSEVAAHDDPVTDEPVPVAASGDEGDRDEFLSQLANLSPKAAAAIEATASADETPSRRLPNGEGDEEINRNLLLKFLSSAKP